MTWMRDEVKRMALREIWHLHGREGTRILNLGRRMTEKLATLLISFHKKSLFKFF